MLHIPDCPYCDQPLDQGIGEIVNGLHAACDRKLNEELHAAFPDELEPKPPEFFESLEPAAVSSLDEQAALVF